jgi:hypothetical protein
MFLDVPLMVISCPCRRTKEYLFYQSPLPPCTSGVGRAHDAQRRACVRQLAWTEPQDDREAHGEGEGVELVRLKSVYYLMDETTRLPQNICFFSLLSLHVKPIQLGPLLSSRQRYMMSPEKSTRKVRMLVPLHSRSLCCICWPIDRGSQRFN